MGKPRSGSTIREILSTKFDVFRSNLSGINSTNLTSSVTRLPNRIKRRLRDSESTSILTMFPVFAVVSSLLFTLFILPHSGVLDCRDGFDNPDFCNEESALNVNGDLEVYLPTDSDPYSVKNLIAEVEKDWTTNVMVIYVESYNYNVT